MTVFADYTAASSEIDLNVTNKSSSDRVANQELGSTLKRLAETLFNLSYNQFHLETADPPSAGLGSNGDVAWSTADKLYSKSGGSWSLDKTLEWGRYRGAHDAAKSYLQHDLVYYSNTFYRANKNNGPAAFDSNDFDLAFNEPHYVDTTGPIGVDDENPTIAEMQTWYDANVGPALLFDYPQAMGDLITYTTPNGKILQYQHFNNGLALLQVRSADLVITQEDFADGSNYYFGGDDTAWKINRYNKTTLVKTSATEANNPAHVALATAWPNRTTLVYG